MVIRQRWMNLDCRITTKAPLNHNDSEVFTELGFMNPSIETCIKMYQANKGWDPAVYMVFEALARERVLIAFNKDNSFAELKYEDKTVIPVFTSCKEIGNYESIAARPVYLRDSIKDLLSFGKSIAVNPFSAPEMQFIIPYEAIIKMLKPVIDRKKS